MKPAVFLDKDGTVVVDVPYNVDPDLMQLMPHAGEALRHLVREEFTIVVVSNQSGVARGLFPISALPGVENQLREMLQEERVKLAGFYYCPHHEQGSVAEFAVTCECRKPQPGLLNAAARELDLDLERSWLIGDILDDVEAGHRAGCRAILLEPGGETEWNFENPLRRPDFVATDLLEAARYIVANQRMLRREEVAAHAN
jgi:D-glycero-D-manno-heptose 1,7-bisphosphate phosphatase